MAMRLSGLMSGMDTESLISQLVEARSVKVNTAKKAQTKLSWQQDAWKELNTKLKNLQSKYISNMRFTSAYSKKVTKVSNSSAVSVLTGESAVNGVQSLEINQLAKTGYLTGAELKASDGSTKGDYTALSKLSDLGFTGSGKFSINVGKKTVDVSVDENTTISDVLSKIKEAGLNASFDAKSQRFFVSSKESGAANDFSITASDENGARALSALGLQAGLSGDNADKATLAKYQAYAQYNVAGDKAATIAKIKAESSLVSDEVTSRTNSYLNSYKSLTASKNAAQKQVDDITKKYEEKGVTLKSADDYKAEIAELEEKLNAEDSPLTDEDRAAIQDRIKELKEYQKDAETLATQQGNVTKIDGQINDMKEYVTITETEEDDGTITYSAEATSKLTGEAEDAYYDKVSFAADVVANPAKYAAGATKVSGQDAEITLNGATFTNSSNVFEINGLTFTALSETKPGESITVTTEQDTDGIYDMVKSFLKEYNSIINEMDKLYNADSAKGYEPLTDEEKEAMSESEVTKYEQKIKDALLRRDSNLSSISNALKSVMSAGVEVNGKTMYLFNFGIDTLGYFNAADNEKNAYHIDGDPDDTDTSGNADKLKSMIASDPDTVVAFFTKLSQNLYEKMTDLSKSVDGYRSFGNFYDDKKMKSDYTDYTSKIADLEKKLNDYEDKWYSKFAKMETAMAKMQSKTSALSGLLGGS